MPNFGLEITLLVLSTLVSVLAVVTGVDLSRRSRRRKIAFTLGAVLLLNGAALVVQFVKVTGEHTREARILDRKAQLVKLLGEEIGKASKIEYDLETNS